LTDSDAGVTGRPRALLIAPPGAGKGTQAAAISAEFGIPTISTGELFRAEIAAGTDLGRVVKAYVDRGDLVPDGLVEELVRAKVQQAVREMGGYLLDGFPRTLAQARTAHTFAVDLGIAADAVLTFDVPRTALLARLLDRAGEGRTDDAVATIMHRLEVYDRETAPVLDYYAQLGVLIRIPADCPISEVTAATIGALHAALATAAG
jgi:adenylate kinase